MFYLYLTDEEFDNDDNPYGKVKLQLKTHDGMDYIPLVHCSEYSDYWTANNKIYCPDYRETDSLSANYYQKEYSMLKLIIQKCNETERNLEGK